MERQPSHGWSRYGNLASTLIVEDKKNATNGDFNIISNARWAQRQDEIDLNEHSSKLCCSASATSEETIICEDNNLWKFHAFFFLFF